MGVKASEALDITFDDLSTYLMTKHSVYMEVDGATYYLTDCNDKYWRAQDTTKLNEKNHFVDCSEIVVTTSTFIDLPWIGENNESIRDAFDRATFYASEKPEA